ncbi:MAG: helix-turn-helix domain-containing protein [Gemmataceae bacterium]
MLEHDPSLVADGLVPLGDAMAFLSISRSTLYELMEKGVLPYAKIGRSRRIPKRALVELAQRTLRGGHALSRIGSAEE